MRETMNISSDPTPRRDDGPASPRTLLPQLAVELVIGLGVALLLVLVGWASSNAIRFVYGGY
jgi:hypothetical protein